MTTRETFASNLLSKRGLPVSVNNLKSVVCWAASENTEAANNPLATTLKYNGSTDFNEAGVQNYATLEDGIDATIETLNNGDYTHIISDLANSDSMAQTCSDIENSVWGSKPNSTLQGQVAADYDTYANVAIGGSADSSDPVTNADEPELQVGSSGEPVEALQTFLNEDCSAHLTVDGEFGEYTKLSVQNFQRFFGLTVDGIVGPTTWSVVNYVKALHGQE